MTSRKFIFIIFAYFSILFLLINIYQRRRAAFYGTHKFLRQNKKPHEDNEMKSNTYQGGGDRICES